MYWHQNKEGSWIIQVGPVTSQETLKVKRVQENQNQRDENADSADARESQATERKLEKATRWICP